MTVWVCAELINADLCMTNHAMLAPTKLTNPKKAQRNRKRARGASPSQVPIMCTRTIHKLRKRNMKPLRIW